MNKLLAFIVFMVWTPVALAEGAAKGPALTSYQLLAQVPILDNGRVKPLDTYARNLLIQFSGKDLFERRPAIAWLAALLFTPDTTTDDKIFLINNPDIAVALNMEPAPHRRYSFKQIKGAYPKLLELSQAAQKVPEKERSIVESELMRVFENARLYADLSTEFIFAVPNANFSITPSAAQAVHLPSGRSAFSFLDIALRADEIHAATQGMENTAAAQWTENQKQFLRVLSKMFHTALVYKDLTLSVIPDKHNPGLWISPWDAIATHFKDKDTRELIVLWRDMTLAYASGEQIKFDLAAQRYLETVRHGLVKGDRKRLDKFSLELMYHTWRPFLTARIFYILAFVFFVASFLSARRLWYRLAWVAIIAGFVPHLLALVARSIIMARPPVSTLYETFIFVSLVMVGLGILIERVTKQWLGIVVASISGTALLFIASKYSSEGDTLKMLVAVLNSNFWLSTHVTSITMGYGATCVAGILGHIYLLQACFKKKPAVLHNTYAVMMGILGLALTLTFLGTNLGGIWADQSWGRFWGWDPKENGALMIVLWSAMLFHARLATMIGPAGMAAGTVLGMIVVMWAWFGVNLLSIGLHSYGFTSGIANTLLIYVVCEIIFLAVCLTKK